MRIAERKNRYLIFTKSVSRFGRNTVDTQDTIKSLHSLGIDVLFEIEDIRISETNKEFLLTVTEAVAQAESESRSQNIKWGIKRHLEKGTSKLYKRRCYSYSNDFPDNKRKINKGESAKYLISDSHPPIITLEQFEQVQAENLRRSNIQNDGFQSNVRLPTIV